LEPEKESSSPRQGLWSLALLGMIFASLTLIASRRNHSTDATHPQNSANEKGGSIPKAVPAVTPNSHPLIPNSANSTQGHLPGSPRWKGVLETVGVASTFGLLLVNLLLSRATKQAADAATSSAATAASQLELVERSWVTIDAKINGPLTFDPSGGHIEFLYYTKNIGTSPATKVWRDSELYISSVKRLDPIKERDRYCESAASESGGLGQTIFPQEQPREERVSLPIGRKDIDSVNVDMQRAYGIKNQFLPVYLITCVTYSPTFNLPKRYYTGNIYDLEKRVLQSPTGMVLLKINENEPASEIIIFPHMIAGTLAR
jgi:hypothetical protein